MTAVYDPVLGAIEKGGEYYGPVQVLVVPDPYI